ncbi:sulfur carrier protein ThiS [Aquimixticola soesokkakensis]|uniref:Sulfur carrier protein ThiS n=1 Tax=Aquimixticola soesokkakensis TaxID=1519096 RepID=A0A1Y5THC7_9RHOB|nr:sulfur carrier protein ThiS [Aquimixticola soesokkakensis]SLN64065.1 sulfur carrier protein ThiS [Aquimixticola soesokkakensis]
MHITVNAKPHDISAQTLAGALAELGVVSPAIATAVNGLFVARDARATTRLAAGDRVEILAPMQGG